MCVHVVFVIMDRMHADFFFCVLAPLDVLDKWATAAVCTRMRCTLQVFFRDWDLEFATRWCATRIDRDHPNDSFVMRTYDPSHFPFSTGRWPTTSRADTPPLMVFEYDDAKEGCLAFEHGRVVEMDVEYLLDPYHTFDGHASNANETRRSFVATPQVSNDGLVFRPLRTLSALPIRSCAWKVHPNAKEFGCFYLMHPVVNTPERVVYHRPNLVVSAEAETVNPRVSVETMGVLMLHKKHYDDASKTAYKCTAHVNMEQLRVYVTPMTVTNGMKARCGL